MHPRLYFPAGMTATGFVLLATRHPRYAAASFFAALVSVILVTVAKWLRV